MRRPEEARGTRPTRVPGATNLVPMEAAMGAAGRRQAERRLNAKAFAIVAVVLLPLAFVAYRPAVILGVEPGALANSVSDASGGSSLGSDCRKQGGGNWFCSVMD